MTALASRSSFTSTRRGVTTRRGLGRFVTGTLLLGMLLVCVFPLFWMIVVSLKEAKDVTNPAVWFVTPNLDNYVDVFVNRNLAHFLSNSAIVAVCATLVSVALGAFAAYGLARFEYRYREDLAFIVLAMRMLPAIAIVIPLFVMAQTIGVLDTHLVLIVCYMLFNIPFSIWMLRGFFEDIPREIEEAALIDGCTRRQILARIIFPLAAPGLAATSIFCLINSWNEFTFAVFLTSVRASTLPTTVTQFLSAAGTSWGAMAATGVVTIVPVLFFSLLVQRYMVKGLSFGGVK